MTMRCKTAAVACVVAMSIGARSGAEDVNPKDLPARVRSIFVAKCAECHGRGLARPRAALYLHELGPLAANRAWVVPFEPEQSYLWTLVRDDDMPAKGATAGPLTAAEKESVRAWIAAGAPVPPSQETPSSESPASPSLAMHLLGWLGRFHLLVLHFPIALLAAAALGEIIAVRRGRQAPDPAVRFCVLQGAAAAVVAAALGWLHADAGGHGSASSDLLGAHRWLGTAAGLSAIAIAWLSERDRRRGQRSVLFRIALGMGAFLVVATAHFGGLMTHGRAFFDW